VTFPKSDLVEDVLILPVLRRDARAGDVAIPAVRGLTSVFREAIAGLRSSAAAGDGVAAAVCALLPKHSAASLTALAGRLAPAARPDGADRTQLDLDAVAPVLYDQAVEAMVEGKAGDATVALGLVAAAPSSRPDGLLGLAVCAARLQNYDAARTLAIETLKHRPGHPRACCIAGLCELERGDRKAAQQYLATAARMARRRPEFRDDLRAAQRLLLMMHMT
jgi:hypothetical protein